MRLAAPMERRIGEVPRCVEDGGAEHSPSFALGGLAGLAVEAGSAAGSHDDRLVRTHGVVVRPTRSKPG